MAFEETQSIAGYTKAITIRGFKDSINALSISGDGAYLVSGGDDGRIRVFSLEVGYKELCRFQNTASILSLAWLNQFSSTFLAGDMLGDLYTLRVLPTKSVYLPLGYFRC